MYLYIFSNVKQEVISMSDTEPQVPSREISLHSIDIDETPPPERDDVVVQVGAAFIPQTSYY